MAFACNKHSIYIVQHQGQLERGCPAGSQALSLGQPHAVCGAPAGVALESEVQWLQPRLPVSDSLQHADCHSALAGAWADLLQQGRLECFRVWKMSCSGKYRGQRTEALICHS